MEIIGAAALSRGIVARRDPLRPLHGAARSATETSSVAVAELSRPELSDARPARSREEALARRERSSANARDWSRADRARARARADLRVVGGSRPSSCCSRRSRTRPGTTPRGGSARSRRRPTGGRAAGAQHPFGVHAAAGGGTRRGDDGLGRTALRRRHEGTHHRPRGSQHPRAGEPDRSRLHHRRHPRAVVLSGFDGVRREIARLTLEKLLQDGRIHPGADRGDVLPGQVRARDPHRRDRRAGRPRRRRAGGSDPELTKLLGRLSSAPATARTCSLIRSRSPASRR